MANTPTPTQQDQWSLWIVTAQQLGFTKMCVIARATYQTLANTGASDIATAWTDQLSTKVINENQELLDNWQDPAKSSFCFFGRQFNVVLCEGEQEPNDVSDKRVVFGYIRVSHQEYPELLIPDPISEIVWKYLNYSPVQCIVGVQGREVVIAYQFNTIWLVAYGPIGQRRRIHRGNGGTDQLKNAQDAHYKLRRHVAEALIDANV